MNRVPGRIESLFVTFYVLQREYLEEYAGGTREQLETARRILASSRDSASGSGPGGRRWTREELYEERLGRYPKR